VMYRLLFCVLHRGATRTGAAQIGIAYRKGYSLESLRDLEIADPDHGGSEHGFYIPPFAEKLFKLNLRWAGPARAVYAAGGNRP